MNFIFQYHLFHTAARESVSRQRKELWSWNKNQNVALEQMKAATMVLNILDYAPIVYIPSFFKDNLTCMIVTFILGPKKHISVTVIVMELHKMQQISSYQWEGEGGLA